MGLLTRFVALFTVRTGEIGVDWRVLGFTLFVSMATGLFFGVVPALASQIDLVSAMKQGSKGGSDKGGRRRLTSGLIVAQVAVSVVLLTGAGLLLTSFYRLQSVNAGYQGDRVMSAEVFANFSRYPDANSQLRLYLPLLERLQGSPGVLSAAITNAVPLSTLLPFAQPFQIEGSVIDNPDKRPTVDARIVSPDYFRTLGIPLVQGRGLLESDDLPSPQVTVINKSMIRYWDSKDPIGSRISLDNGQTWLTVVGVVGDVKQFGLDKESIAQIYTPLRQMTQGLAGRVLVRTNGDAKAAAQVIKEAVRSIDQDMPIANVRTLEEIRGTYLATPRLTAVLLTMFGALALIVTMAGLAGVIGTSVSQRTQEFGMRMALGATRDGILRMVVRQGLRLVIVGLVIGVIGSYAFTGFLSKYLFETSVADPVSTVAVLLTFVAAGLLACLGPALRATRVDPLVALRGSSRYRDFVSGLGGVGETTGAGVFAASCKASRASATFQSLPDHSRTSLPSGPITAVTSECENCSPSLKKTSPKKRPIRSIASLVPVASFQRANGPSPRSVTNAEPKACRTSGLSQSTSKLMLSRRAVFRSSTSPSIPFSSC